MTTKVRLFLFGCLSLALLVGMTVFGIYQASQSVPQFYQEALTLKPAEADRAGEELERHVLSLQNELQDRQPDWQLRVTDQQINGWLSSDLHEKFPELLPKDVENPRIQFDDGNASIACRLKVGQISVVLSILLQAYLTDQPNEIAIQVEHVRAGKLPVPLHNLLDQIAAAALDSGVVVRWSQHNGDPVALIRLPASGDTRNSNNLVLQQLNVKPGELQVAGGIDPAQPRVAESVGEKINRQ